MCHQHTHKSRAFKRTLVATPLLVTARSLVVRAISNINLEIIMSEEMDKEDAYSKTLD